MELFEHEAVEMAVESGVIKDHVTEHVAQHPPRLPRHLVLLYRTCVGRCRYLPMLSAAVVANAQAGHRASWRNLGWRNSGQHGCTDWACGPEDLPIQHITMNTLCRLSGTTRCRTRICLSQVSVLFTRGSSYMFIHYTMQPECCHRSCHACHWLPWRGAGARCIALPKPGCCKSAACDSPCCR